ncbi:hypothetical protein [Methylobacterium sp. CM6247]
MTETIKQALARAKGDVFVLLASGYTESATPHRLKIHKPDARRIVDAAPKQHQPHALWEGENLILTPACKTPTP